MATKMQRQEARRRARELKIQEEAKLQEALKRKSDAREEAFICLDQVDDVHARAGAALQVLLDGGDSRDDIADVFGLTKSELSGYLRSARDATDAVSPSSSDDDQEPSDSGSSVQSDRGDQDTGITGSSGGHTAPSYA